MAISPFIKHQLSIYEANVNRDYGFGRLGEAGEAKFNDFLGVTFIVTNMLPTFDTVDSTGATVSDCRMCCAWLKNRISYGIWRGTSYQLLPLSEKVDVRYRLLAKGRMGCARKDEDSVFVIPMTEA